ncbi:MAG: S8 family serine peptidase, partial [Lachnospiraceae bacterium]|nr:S8 family serine peptidase [Lachnospiraceae bacterium]
RTGTSVAAAHMAGAAACLLEWGIVRGNRLWINNNAIRAVLIQGARRNPSLTYPNEQWGYGTLDLYGTFNSI